MNLVDALRREIAKALLAQVPQHNIGRQLVLQIAGDRLREEDFPAIRRHQQAAQPVETRRPVVAVRLGIDLAGVQRHADPRRGRHRPRLDQELLLRPDRGAQRAIGALGKRPGTRRR